MKRPAAWAYRLAWAPALATAAALLLLLTPLGTTLSRPASDWQLRRLAPIQPPANVVVVDIDDAALQALKNELGAWPFRRDTYALLIDWLRDAGASVIALDLLFADAHPGDLALARAAARPGAPVVLGAAGLRGAGAAAAAPPPVHPAGAAPAGAVATVWPTLVFPSPTLWASADGAPRLGVITAPLDDDGRLRDMALWHRAHGSDGAAATLWPSMPLAVWQALIPAGSAPVWPTDRRGHVHLALPESSRMAAGLSFTSLARAALGLQSLDPALVRGKAVFIGSSALLADNVMTVSGQSSGTAVLAQTYAALRDGTVLPAPNRALDALLAAMALLPACVLALRGRPSWPRDLLLSLLVLAMLAATALGMLFGLRQTTAWAPALLAWLVGLAAAAWAHQQALLQAQRRLAYERAVAAEANRAKSEFLANVSHEIRTPLNALMGIAELLGDSPLTARQREHVRVFQESGVALRELIDDLLDVSKIEAGRFELHSQPFSLRAVLGRLHALLQGRAEAKGLRFSIEAGPGVPDGVLGDRQRLEQALINLLGNAIKFTPQGRVELRVELAEPAPQLLFMVSDTGIGIAPSKLESIFEPFSQADGSVTRQFGGTGLGLSITRSIARLMGGSIEVESRPALGTRFRLQVPLPAAALPAAPASEVPPGLPLAGQALRVLLAEDNEVNVYVFRGLVEGPGVQVDVAPHGAAALALAQARRYDIAFIDLQMPGMDGLTLTRELRALEQQLQRPRLPLVALTANAFASDVQRSLEAGCDRHLTKPAAKADLLHAIVELVPAAPGPARADSGDAAGPQPAAHADAQAVMVHTGLDRSVLDRAAALARLGGDEALHRRVADHAAVFMLHWAEDFAAAQRDGQGARALRLAHDLKSIARSVGATALGDSAAALESSMRSNPNGPADLEALAQVRRQLPAVVTALAPPPPAA